MQKIAWFLFVALTVFTLLLAGCGDDDGIEAFQLNDCRLDDANCQLQ